MIKKNKNCWKKISKKIKKDKKIQKKDLKLFSMIFLVD